jgi:hypothetical protein
MMTGGRGSSGSGSGEDQNGVGEFSGMALNPPDHIRSLSAGGLVSAALGFNIGF